MVPVSSRVELGKDLDAILADGGAEYKKAVVKAVSDCFTAALTSLEKGKPVTEIEIGDVYKLTEAEVLNISGTL